MAPASVPAQVPYRTIVVGGMPGWQIALIAVGAALLAATMAVLADRVRAARRPAVPTAPEPCTQFTRCRRPPVLAGGTAAGRLGPTPE